VVFYLIIIIIRRNWIVKNYVLSILFSPTYVAWMQMVWNYYILTNNILVEVLERLKTYIWDRYDIYLSKIITYLEHFCNITGAIDSVNASKSLRIIRRKVRRENAIWRTSPSQILASCTTTRNHPEESKENLMKNNLNYAKILSIFFCSWTKIQLRFPVS
jgi:hypothetical protein